MAVDLTWNPTQRVATATEYDWYLHNLRITAGMPKVRELPSTFVMAKMPPGYQPPPGYEQEYQEAAAQVVKYTPKVEVSTFQIPPEPAKPLSGLVNPKVEEKINRGQELSENEILELLIVIILAILSQGGG